jgi:oligopeptide/dipeptide ABC transporter ATP-binding protein
VESAPVRNIFNNPTHHYTAALLQSVPKLEQKVERLASIPGQPPRPGDFPKGCRFAPRCARADHKCTTEEPPVTTIEADHEVKCWYPLD